MFVGFHPALRINTNPLNPALGVVETINLAVDHPANFGLRPPLEFVRCSHSLLTDFQLTEQVAPYSTRRRSVKGLGVRLRWEIEASFYPIKSSEFAPSFAHRTSSAYDEQMQILLNALAVGASGFNDGVSRYVWFTPNYQWGDPAEQWFRVLPDGVPAFSMPGKTYSSVLRITVITAQNYKSANWRYYHRGFRTAATGTVSTTVSTTAVVGFGLANFLSDFIPGDILRTAAGLVLGTVASVQSALSMTLELPGATATYSGAAVTEQKSCPTFAVPVYDAVPFAPSAGWSLSPWGDNWNN